jgi:hypothetical protein
MNSNQLERLFPKFQPSVFVTLASGVTAGDRIAAFRYDGSVYKLSDFTSDSETISKRLEVVQEFVRKRPNETADVLGERGPRWFRSIINILGSTQKSERPARGVLHDAIHEAAEALRKEDADRRRIILLISDGFTTRGDHHNFDQNYRIRFRSSPSP